MRAGTLTLLAAVAAVGMATTADATTTIGSNLTQPATNTIQDAGTYATRVGDTQTAASGGFVAPFPGVITSWAIRSLGPTGVTTTMQLVVIAGNTGVAKGSVVPVPVSNSGNVFAFATRMPIAAGQRIGLDVAPTPGNGANINLPIVRKVGGSTLDIDYWNPVLGVGESRTPTAPPGMLINQDSELNLQATIEPDADGDGWGDETQDDCVGTAGTDHGCVPATVIQPPPTDPNDPTNPSRPDTTITSGPTTTKKPKATFAFSSDAAGAIFECALDKGGFTACSSPTTLKHISRGSHTFSVRAISAAGLIDATPATQSFRVKRKKPKPK